MEYTTELSSIVMVLIVTASVAYLAIKGELFKNW